MNVPESNPYAAPQAAPGDPPPGTNATWNPLKIPAIGLLLMGFVSLTAFPIRWVLAVEQRGQIFQTNIPQLLMIVEVGMLLAQFFVIWGALHMVRLRNFRMARRAAILSCVPLLTPCLVLGLPFGLWTLVLLLRPRVRASFSDP